MIRRPGVGDAFSSEIAVLAPERGLEQERELLRAVAEGQVESGRLVWTTGRCLVAPRAFGRLAGFPSARAALSAEGWPLHLRDTGGDVFPQGHGIVNLAIAFRLPRGDFDRIAFAYGKLCAPIVEAATDCGLVVRCQPVPGALCTGSHDLVFAGRKFAGVAQRWQPTRSAGERCDAALVHAGVLCVGDVAPMVSAANRFYRNCGLDRRVRADSHRALFQDQGVADAWSMTTRFVGLIVERIDRAGGRATASRLTPPNRVRTHQVATAEDGAIAQ